MLSVHVGIAALVVIGQIAILAGGALGFCWVRNRRFRIVHLGLIVFIAAQTWLGQLCPLTILEQSLRERANQPTYSGSFVEHWLAPLIFFDAPWWMFTALHTSIAALVVGSWWWVPPDRSRPTGVPQNDSESRNAR